MTGTLWRTKVLYGQRVIYLKLPYATRDYGANVSGVAGDTVTLSCAVKAILTNEITNTLFTRAGVVDSSEAQGANILAYVGYYEPTGTANVIGRTAEDNDFSPLSRAIAAGNLTYSANSFSDVSETTATLINIIAASGDEAWFTFNQIARVMLLMSEILKTFYAILPERITEVETTPMLLTEISPYLRYTTALSAYSDKKTICDTTPTYTATVSVTPEYLTEHDPYIHYTTESEVY